MGGLLTFWTADSDLFSPPFSNSSVAAAAAGGVSNVILLVLFHWNAAALLTGTIRLQAQHAYIAIISTSPRMDSIAVLNSIQFIDYSLVTNYTTE